MRVRTLVSIERESLRALKARAKARGVSVAELVREAIDRSLATERPSEAIPSSVFERIVGMGESGHADVSERHDEWLAAALRKRHRRKEPARS